MQQNILLHSSMIMPDIGLNSIFCCLKMKSVSSILGYFLEQFQRFSRGLQPLENLQNCSRIYPKMFSTDFIFRQQENLVDNQKSQAGFRPLRNKIPLPLGNSTKLVFWSILSFFKTWCCEKQLCQQYFENTMTNDIDKIE